MQIALRVIDTANAFIETKLLLIVFIIYYFKSFFVVAAFPCLSSFLRLLPCRMANLNTVSKMGND